MKNTIPLLCLLIVFSGCLQEEAAERVNLGERVQVTAPIHEAEYIKIGVSAIISPEESLIYYEDLFNYISKNLGKPVRLIQRKSYQEMNELVKKGHVDVAFICSLAYVEGREQFGMELLVVPVVNGKTVYYSYTIVPADSNVTEFRQLRDKRFAFSDPLSNSGYLVPTYMLVKMGENPDTFFNYFIFTYSHDRSIKAVADKLVDGANVDSLIWDYLNATNPQLTARTKIIKRSPPYGIPPVVVPRDLDPALKEELRSIFLRMHEDEEGRKVLEKIMIDRFVMGKDRDYDSIREIRSLVKEKYEK
jgi:phosphonate transport system substrate-binding protein